MNAATSVDHTERLHGLLREKLALLQTIRSLTLQQQQHVYAEDVDSLLSVLGRKDTAMAGLQKLQAALLIYRDDDAEARTWPNPQRRQEAADIQRECEQLVQQLLQFEQDSLQQLEKSHHLARQELKVVHHAAAIESAYGSGDGEEASFSLEG